LVFDECLPGGLVVDRGLCGLFGSPVEQGGFVEDADDGGDGPECEVIVVGLLDVEGVQAEGLGGGVGHAAVTSCGAGLRVRVIR
jgi:hypothetical protein